MSVSFRLLTKDELVSVAGAAEIVVNGIRFSDPGSYGGGSASGGGGGAGYESGDDRVPLGDPGTGNDFDPCQQEGVIDSAAESEAAQINAAMGQLPGVMNTGTSEYGSLIYVNAFGQIESVGPFQGETVGLTGQLFIFEDLEEAFADTGLDRSAIVGFVHNHPGGTFGDVDLNRYPSPTDWIYMDIQVENGGVNAFVASIYIVDAFGVVREFPYTDRVYYDNLTDEQKRNGEGLPDGTNGGEPCG